ncbi:MAG: UDP-3-O-(3-hydroxymyristoyl)glucosamine N-acyltransferase, partial [Deltaproteobacteria bacterium]|nr:UDP-3-O-(3-hydroxymyristoyl)glucosamine N-acyltransferase [Deltaproteobacteria bacterium]
MRTATLRELAALVNGTVSGDDRLTVTGFNSLELAVAGELSFINTIKLAGKLAETRASACIVPANLSEVELPVIRVDNPDLAAALIHNYLLAEDFKPAGIHPSVVIGSNSEVSDNVTIAPHVTIGD